MNTANNSNFNRPALRKVKRPINRMPQNPTFVSKQKSPEFFEEAKTYETFSPAPANVKDNPFIQQPQELGNINKNNDTGFDLDAFLDNDVAMADTVSDENILIENEEYNHLSNNASGIDVYLSKKSLIFSAIAILFLGVIIGKFFFTDSKVVRDGLQGVVLNPEVPKGRARCGVAERTQGCVLYIMNPQRYDANARDFYDLASTLTGRQKFVIETGNIRYANQRIRPGEIVQLNIPPL